MGNLVRTYNLTKTYVDEDTLRSVIFTAAVFANFSTANRLKYYSPGQFRSVHNIIIPINERWIRN